MRVPKARDEKSANKYQRWTPEEDTALKAMRESGLTIRQIAAETKRTHIGVLERLKSFRRAARLASDAS